MLSSKVAKRYAQGLLEFASETNAVDPVFEEMKQVVKIMDSSKELNSFLNTPFIETKKKIETADQIFNGFSQASKNFIFLIIKHGRENQLKNIAQQYIDNVEDMKGIQRVTVTSASELSKENIDKILRSTHLLDHSKPYDLKTILNPELVGGYILRVGDQQVDASVKSKLSQLRKDFNLN